MQKHWKGCIMGLSQLQTQRVPLCLLGWFATPKLFAGSWMHLLNTSEHKTLTVLACVEHSLAGHIWDTNRHVQLLKRHQQARAHSKHTCFMLNSRSQGAVHVMQGLLRHVLDTNKHVQEAACSALATLEEQFIPELLVPCLRVILETLAKACATYGRKNLRILYDAISTLAEMAGKELADPSLLRIYMPPLVAKWQSLGDTDRDLLPLLECFTGITSAVGECPKFEAQCHQASLAQRLPLISVHIATDAL